MTSALVRRLLIPEHTWLLRRPATAALAREMASEQVDCLITGSFPFALHTVASAAKRRRPDLVWVADNRDEWHGNPYRAAPLVPAALERRIERQVFEACDIASFVSPSTLARYRARYPAMRRAILVRNGAEPVAQALSRAQGDGVLSLVHTGSLYAGRRDLSPALAALDGLRAEGIAAQVALAGGDSKSERDRLAPRFETPIVAHGSVSRDAAQALQVGADVLLLCMADTPYDRVCTPGKVFEYAQSGRPIIALVDEVSDLAEIIDGYRLGIATFDTARIADFVRDVRAGRWSPPPTKTLRELTADFQFAQMVDAVEEELAARAPSGAAALSQSANAAKGASATAA